VGLSTLKGLAGDAHRGSSEFINHWGGGKSRFMGNISITVRLDQRSCHRSVFRRLGILHEVDQFGASAFANPLAGGGLIFEVLPNEKELFI
jgi:hypothetical protein